MPLPRLPNKYLTKMAVALVQQAQAAPKSIAIGLTLAAVGAIAFSGKAIIVKLAYRHGVDAVTLIMLRMLFALPFFFPGHEPVGQPQHAAPHARAADP